MDTQSISEIKLIKNIEIVIDVFRKSADKVGKTGEKEWKDVIEQQSYVLDEVIKMHDEIVKSKATKHQRMGSTLSKHAKT